MKISTYISDARKMDGVILPEQCHGDRIVHVDTGYEDVTQCDALVTENHMLKLGVYTADCAPICFTDGVRVGIAHVGWRGLCAGLIEKMLLEFEMSTLQVFVGPHLHAFSIQKDFCYEMILKKFDTTFFIEEEGVVTFQFKNAIASILPSGAVFDERSTGKDLGIPSHRLEKATKRLITVVSCTE